jgi:histone arginine demethylase JMJD6
VLPREPGLGREAIDWFTKVFPRALAPEWPAARPLTIVQRPGETVFVPHGACV